MRVHVESPTYYRGRAEHCRNVAKLIDNPAIEAQLLMFAEELDEAADSAEALTSVTADKQS